MSRSGSAPERLRVAALRNNTPTTFDIRPDDEARAALASELGLLGLRKLRLAATSGAALCIEGCKHPPAALLPG